MFVLAENDASETENDLRAWGYVPATLELEKNKPKEKKDDKASDESVKDTQ